jgi:hypothetical protein
MPIIPALECLIQEDLMFDANLGYIAKILSKKFLRKKKEKKNIKEKKRKYLKYW